ncbi:MAG: helix-turn-helix domain-containing protein [Muribaculaceae bacterium]|nr:helix-turn-helix domain-containing protein [Muribaculaceae bacterium]
MPDDNRINNRLRRIEKSIDEILNKMSEFIESSKIPDRLISTEEAAEYLGVSIECVRKEIRAGNLPAEKGPRSYRISLRSVLERVGIDDLRTFQKKS